jgi:hypothetical protein
MPVKVVPLLAGGAEKLEASWRTARMTAASCTPVRSTSTDTKRASGGGGKAGLRLLSFVIPRMMFAEDFHHFSGVLAVRRVAPVERRLVVLVACVGVGTLFE